MTDAMLEHNHSIFASEVPRKREVENVRNWLDNKASVARDETAYLFKTQDLMTVQSSRDETLSRLTPLTERFVSVLCRLLKKASHPFESTVNCASPDRTMFSAAPEYSLAGSQSDTAFGVGVAETDPCDHRLRRCRPAFGAHRHHQCPHGPRTPNDGDRRLFHASHHRVVDFDEC